MVREEGIMITLIVTLCLVAGMSGIGIILYFVSEAIIDSKEEE